jgi:hypothetical protein
VSEQLSININNTGGGMDNHPGEDISPYMLPDDTDRMEQSKGIEKTPSMFDDNHDHFDATGGTSGGDGLELMQAEMENE